MDDRLEDQKEKVTRVTLAESVKVRSTALTIMAVIAIVFFVQWARPVLIPITAAVMLSYALTPMVTWLQKRLKIHKAIGAAVTLSFVLLVLGFGLRALQPQAIDLLDIVPKAVHKLTLAIGSNPLRSGSTVSKVTKAATEIENAAIAATTPNGTSVAAAKPAPVAPTINLREYLLMGTAGALASAGQFFVLICLVYFLLITGDAFRRTLVRVSGDTLSKKKLTLQILDEIDSQIQRYLLVQLVTSVLFGAIAGAMLAVAGVDNATMWGSVGAVLHLIPYIGPAAFVALIALIAYVQLEALRPVVILIAAIVASLGVIGFLIVPWFTQKIGRIKAVTVFIALLVWGWLWGTWGLLLGVPIVMAIAAVCERTAGLEPIAAFLGEDPVQNDTTPAKPAGRSHSSAAGGAPESPTRQSDPG